MSHDCNRECAVGCYNPVTYRETYFSELCTNNDNKEDDPDDDGNDDDDDDDGSLEIEKLVKSISTIAAILDFENVQSYPLSNQAELIQNDP